MEIDLQQLRENGFVKLPFQFEENFIKALEFKDLDKRPGERGLFNKINFSESIPFLRKYKIVRTIFFNKTQKTNWLVPWHQDLTVALKEKKKHPDFKNWTLKKSIPHAEAPISLLEKMITLRIFLDPADEKNGGLWVLPKSHRFGRVKQNQIEKIIERSPKEICFVGERGTGYLFSPLILHRSGKSISDKPRRVLQIEMAQKGILPKPLEWYF